MKATTIDDQSRFEKKAAIDPLVAYHGEYLTRIDFPIGALGESVIRMNGTKQLYAKKQCVKKSITILTIDNLSDNLFCF